MAKLTFYEVCKPGVMKTGDVFVFENSFFGKVIKNEHNYYSSDDQNKRIYINDDCSNQEGQIIPAKKEMVNFNEFWVSACLDQIVPTRTPYECGENRKEDAEII